MICKKCGNDIPEKSKFCPECGVKLFDLTEKNDTLPEHFQNTIQDTEDEENFEDADIVKNKYLEIKALKNKSDKEIRTQIRTMWILFLLILFIVGCIFAVPKVWSLVEEATDSKKATKTYYTKPEEMDTSDDESVVLETTDVTDADSNSGDTTEATQEEQTPVEEAVVTNEEGYIIPQSYEPATVVVGEMMPPFHFTDLYGKQVTLEQILASGKAVYVNTFTSWCTYCKEEAPSMVSLATAYKDVIQFVFIDFGEGYDVTYNYHIENELYAGMVGYTTDWALGGVAIDAVPQSYIISREGIVVESITGAQSYSQIESNIVDGITYTPQVTE